MTVSVTGLQGSTSTAGTPAIQPLPPQFGIPPTVSLLEVIPSCDEGKGYFGAQMGQMRPAAQCIGDGLVNPQQPPSADPSRRACHVCHKTVIG
jgi:hypothetical protein